MMLADGAGARGSRQSAGRRAPAPERGAREVVNVVQASDVARVLNRLAATPDFKALWGGPDVRSREFLLRVERLRLRCRQYRPEGPTALDVPKELRLLEGLCIEGLSGFHPWIESARAALLARPTPGPDPRVVGA